jgi:YD repeat-containing protein
MQGNGDNGVLCAPGSAIVPDPAGGTRPIGVLCARSEQATTDANGSQGTNATPTGTPRIWTSTYNAQGQKLTEDGPRTDVTDTTAYSYHSLTDSDIGRRGNLATVTNALGHTTAITAYDANGNPLTLTDPNGVTTTLTYDARQRLTSKTTASETTTYDYNATGQLIEVTLPDSSSISYAYDNAHRLTDITDTLGNTIHYTLDNAGNRIQEDIKDPQNVLTRTRSRVYDALSQLLQDIGAQNQTTTLTYDANGNQTNRTDPLNHSTVKAYDALNRLIEITDPNTGQIQTAWNGQDQITGVTDPRSLVTTYTRNGFGETTQTQSPDTGTTTSTFDSAGNEITRTDAKGQTTATNYDALNRPIQTTDADGKEIHFTWDQGTNGKGRLTEIEEKENGTTTLQVQYSYDAHGRLLSEIRSLLINGSTITHTQSHAWTNGRLTSQTLPSGRTLTYTYNAAGQITKIELTESGQTQTIAQTITYHPWGGIKSWSDGAGQAHTRTQDLDGRTNSYTLNGTPWQLSYDAAGRIIGQQINTTTSGSYTYDNLDRLTGAQLPNTSYAYAYDATGNRTSKTTGGTSQTYTIQSASNRLQSVSGTPTQSFTYDATGSVTNDSNVQYVYDALGRLKQTTAGTQTTDYRVSALGERIKKDGTYYHYDQGGKLIAESNAAGAVQREYIWLGATPIAIVE